MGQANACIGFGVEVEETPWGELGIDDWWLKETGFDDSNNPFDESGFYKPDIPEEEGGARYNAYFKEKETWLKQHPCPFDYFICGSDEAHKTVICAPGSIYSTDWEGSMVLPTIEEVTPKDLAAFVEFCTKYNLPTDPVWRMGASWG